MINVFCASLGSQIDVRMGFNEKNSMNLKDSIKPYWLRACTEIKVQLVGYKGEILVLLDCGLELNLMSKKLYERSQWMMDRDVK